VAHPDVVPFIRVDAPAIIGKQSFGHGKIPPLNAVESINPSNIGCKPFMAGLVDCHLMSDEFIGMKVLLETVRLGAYLAREKQKAMYKKVKVFHALLFIRQLKYYKCNDNDGRNR